MDDISSLLQMIGSMEGRTITRELARSCRDLAGPQRANEPVMELIKGQLLILMLKDLGGEKKYTIDAIDNETSGKLLMLERIRYKGQDALRFFLKDKR